MDSSKRVYGIDLGTTYSCIATIDEYGNPVVLKNSLDSDVTPSVVFYESDSKVVVGETAKEEVDASCKVEFIKREMGNDHFVSTCKYPEDPATVSAYILGQLVKDANESLMEDIKDVVITCPAYFGTKERLLTKEAGLIAGLNVLSIINEPTAAAISYGLKSDEDKVILVYDLGGGTFDITVIEVSDSKIKVVATGGDPQLGGADWDAELIKHIEAKFEAETGLSNISSDPNTRVELQLAAEKAKKSLTSKDKYKTRITHDGESVSIEVTREEFDSITADLLSRTISILNTVIEKAKEKDPRYGNYSEVLLVGGSTYMPQVKIAVDSALGCDSKRYEPNAAVAKGAAIFAMNEKSFNLDEGEDEGAAPTPGGPVDFNGGGAPKKQKKEIVNVLSKTYGVSSVIPMKNGEYYDVISNMLFEQDEVPISATKVFTSVENGQTAMSLDLFESSTTRNDTVTVEGVTYKEKAERIYGGDPLCGVLIEFGGAYPEGYPIEVTVTLNAEGIIVVTARDQRTGKEVTAEAKIEGIRSTEEVAQAAKKFSGMTIES